MNNLLPSLEQLKPLKNQNGTFSNSVFHQDFEKLSFQDKLQVINDIVKQTMIFEFISNPKTDLETLKGNCHTAALISISYLKSLNIGKNHKYVLGRQRFYEPDDITTKHALVLVEDELGLVYQFDATPFVGETYGKVAPLKEKPFYKEYVELKGDLEVFVRLLRDLLYDCKISTMFEKEKIEKYLNLLRNAQQYPILNGLIALCFDKLSQCLQGTSDQFEFQKKAQSLNPYLDVTSKKAQLKRQMINIYIKKIQEELHDLQYSNKNYKRQLELAQTIFQRLKTPELEMKQSIVLNKERISFCRLSPRLFYEYNLNTVIINPSASYLGVRGTIREEFFPRGKKPIDEYFADLAKPTSNSLLKPILFSHPLGDSYERSMTGSADVLLISENAEKIKNIKNILGKELGQNIMYKDVLWSDNKPIYWHPFVTNLVHTTDNPSEACLHYLIAYPEEQLMTCFMYPNPNLERSLKK